MQPWMLSRRTASCTTLLAVGVLYSGMAYMGAGPLAAAEAAPAKPATPMVVVGEPAAIAIIPEKFDLNGKRSRQQMLVTGQYANNELRDLSPAVEFISTAPQIVKV